MRTRTFVLALLPLAGGCVVAAVGAAVAYGVIKVKNNEAYRDFKTDLETTWKATKDELEARGYKFDYNAEYNAHDGRIESADAKVKVGVGYEDTTRVSVTIGTFETDANIEAAKRILRGIAKRLGEPE